MTKIFAASGTPAVAEFSVEISAGCFAAIVGESGSGKSTVLKLVNRLLEPDAGRIRIEGEDIAKLDPIRLRRSIGYVVQQNGLFPHMTVAANIGIVPKLLNWSPEKIDRRTDELLDLVKLPASEFRDRFPGRLSGGQQQRVGIARALAADPPLVLMDEPFSALDPVTRAALQDEMLALRRTIDKTVLFVTHDIDEALKLADVILVLHRGRLAQMGTPAEILLSPANDYVADLFDCRNVLRTLSVLRVRAATVPSDEPGHGGALHPDEDLRRALSRMIESGATSVPVRDGDRVLGAVTLASLRAALNLHAG